MLCTSRFLRQLNTVTGLHAQHLYTGANVPLLKDLRGHHNRHRPRLLTTSTCRSPSILSCRWSLRRLRCRLLCFRLLRRLHPASAPPHLLPLPRLRIRLLPRTSFRGLLCFRGLFTCPTRRSPIIPLQLPPLLPPLSPPSPSTQASWSSADGKCLFIATAHNLQGFR